MNIKTFLVSAAALTFAASALQATPSEQPDYTARAEARLRSMLRASGLDFAGLTVSVRASVAPDGKLTGMTVVRGSGSRAADLAAERVLRKIVVTDPPLGLSDGAVTLNLNLSPAPVVQAAAR